MNKKIKNTTEFSDDELKKSEQKYRHLVETSLQGIVILQDFKIVYANPAFANITGYSIEELLSFTPQNTMNLVHPDEQSVVWNNYKQRLAGIDIPPHYIFKGVSKDKSIKYLDLYVSKIEYDGKMAVQGLILDMTEQVTARKVLEQRNKFIETILNNIPLGIVVSEIDSGKSTFVNSEFEEILGWAGDEIITIDSLLKKFPNNSGKKTHLSDKIKADIMEKKPEDLFWENIEVNSKSGERKYLSVKYIPLYDQNLLITTLQDMTDRITADMHLQSSLIEKEILLREIHHRVKNNLQTISSLLDLQAESISDPKSLEAFRSSQSRIRSMALIHERLYKSENLSRIKACEYIKNLTEYLESTFIAQSGSIELKTEVEDIYLSLDVAIPCGLIINELVSNAMKYAFSGRKNGKLFVQFRIYNTKYLKLIVKDNGIGISVKTENESSSLGLQLVGLLVKQINGNLTLDNSNGTTFEITFPLQHL